MSSLTVSPASVKTGGNRWLLTWRTQTSRFAKGPEGYNCISIGFVFFVSLSILFYVFKNIIPRRGLWALLDLLKGFNDTKEVSTLLYWTFSLGGAIRLCSKMYS